VIAEFSNGLASGSEPGAPVAGPDGVLYFPDDGTTAAIGQIAPSGVITEFSNGLAGESAPTAMAGGPDGNVWFTSDGVSPAIGQITPSGTINEFTAGLGPASEPESIVSGPDGNLWFTDDGVPAAIGQVPPNLTPSPPPPPPPPPPALVAPRLTHVGQSHRTWRVGNRLATIARATAAPVGTVFSFTLNERAKVTFAFDRVLPGVVVEGKCGANTWTNQKYSCARTVPAGMFAFTGAAGHDKVSFQGRVAHREKLEPGRYKVEITATASGATSATTKLQFQIIAAPKRAS